MRRLEGRREFILKGTALTSALLLPNFGLRSHGSIKVAMVVPPQFPILGDHFSKFLGELSSLTNLAYEVYVVPSAHTRRVHKLVSNGYFDMALASYCKNDLSPVFQLFNSLPFGLKSNQHKIWMADKGHFYLKELYAEKNLNLVSFPFGFIGTQNGGRFKILPEKIKSFNSLVVRAPGIAGDVLARLGAQNIPLSFKDFRKRIGQYDYVNWAGPFLDHKFGVAETHPFEVVEAWQQPNISFEVIFNSKVFKQLSRVSSASSFDALVSMNSDQFTKKWMSLDRMYSRGDISFKIPDPLSKDLKSLTHEMIWDSASSSLEKEALASYLRG